MSCKTNKEVQSHYFENHEISKIDSLINRYLELNRFSGTVLIVENNSVKYNRSFGLANYEDKIPFSNKTVFKIGEITEIITYNIVNRLVKEGKIKLTDKLSQHLREIESNITVNDFINQNVDVDYNYMGRLIEKVTNKNYQKNIEEYSDLLGLENTFFQKTDALTAIGYLYQNYRGKGLELQRSPIYDLEEEYSSKGLKSTANDLVKILKSNPKKYSIDGYLDNDGFSYSLVNDINNKTSIIILSNRRHPVAKEISNSINAILNDKEYKLPLLREPFNIDKTILKDFEGIFSINKDVSFEVFESNDSLFVTMGSNKTYLIPQSSNQFYMEQSDAAMRFLRDSTDLINRIVLLDGFIDSEQTATRIK